MCMPPPVRLCPPKFASHCGRMLAKTSISPKSNGANRLFSVSLFSFPLLPSVTLSLPLNPAGGLWERCKPP